MEQLRKNETDLQVELKDLDGELSRIADALAAVTDPDEREQLAAEQDIAADRLVIVVGLLRQVQRDLAAAEGGH